MHTVINSSQVIGLAEIIVSHNGEQWDWTVTPEELVQAKEAIEDYLTCINWTEDNLSEIINKITHVSDAEWIERR